jgi:hypothetical protein
MRRPLMAVLSVLVAATFASGHSAAQGPRSAKGPVKTPAKAPTQKLESVMACMKYRQQRLVEDGGLRMELRNCCHGPVKCAISWQVRCEGGKPDAQSADLQIPAGSTESAYGYGAECGNRGWQIMGVRWSCETAGAGEGEPGSAPSDDR